MSPYLEDSEPNVVQPNHLKCVVISDVKFWRKVKKSPLSPIHLF